MTVINRTLQKYINQYKTKYPILAITGPRQSGKTTMLKTMFPNYTYLSLENPDTREFAATDPNGFFNHYQGNLILDEVQRTPQLFSYLQTKADESKKMGKYILSGSQNFHLMHNITQSLAGRVALFKLLPFDFTEMKSSGLLKQDYAENIVNGSYPALYDRKINAKVFYANYIETYVEKDITELIKVKDLKLFRNFLGLCATRAGQLLNLNAIANECGISQPTAKSWLSVLESSYIIFLLHPYHENFSKRIVKTPKLYFFDTGLLCHLLSLNSADILKTHSYKGSLFENMIAAELMKQNEHRYLHHKFWFWRDSAGHETDLVIQKDNGLHALEIKATQTITTDHFKGLDYFENLVGNKLKSKTLIYAGEQTQQRSNATVQSWNRMEKL